MVINCSYSKYDIKRDLSSMHEKIRVAFIYKKSCEFLTGKHFANTYYHFFMDALRRNQKLVMNYIETGDSYDVRSLKGKIDVILLFDNSPIGTPELIGIKDMEVPVISRVNDPHDAKRLGKIECHDRYKIDYYFGYMPESYFHRFYPKSFKFETIVYGLESSLYQNLTPYKDRIRDRILNSGAVGNPKFHSRLINTIRNPTSNAYKHYKLRTLCNKLPYVDYTPTLEHDFINDQYPLLLSKYAAAICATTYFPTIRYMEIPAAGCLTFMEITNKNNGYYLGYKDGISAIFINENNYEKKFQEYIQSKEDPRWEQIANAGRNHALNNLNNDKAVERLVSLMEKLTTRA